MRISYHRLLKLNFAKNSSNIKTYLWDEKELKAITVLYRFRINRPKFARNCRRRNLKCTKNNTSRFTVLQICIDNLFI